MWDFRLSLNLLRCSRGLLEFDQMGRWQWGLPCSRVLTRRDERLAGCRGAWMEVGGRMTECSGAGALEERPPPSTWTVASLLVWISLPSCIKLHSVMSTGKAISCGSELHTQGVPCCNLITNLIFGHRLPDSTMLLSSLIGSLCGSRSECQLLP